VRTLPSRNTVAVESRMMYRSRFSSRPLRPSPPHGNHSIPWQTFELECIRLGAPAAFYLSVLLSRVRLLQKVVQSLRAMTTGLKYPNKRFQARVVLTL
jgi:hypothetical protein